MIRHRMGTLVDRSFSLWRFISSCQYNTQPLGYHLVTPQYNQTNIIHRPEPEALDIQSELIFVNGMVHLTQEYIKLWYTKNFPSPPTHHHPLQRLLKCLRDVTHSIYLRIKSLLCVLSMLLHFRLEYKSVSCYSQSSTDIWLLP